MYRSTANHWHGHPQYQICAVVKPCLKHVQDKPCVKQDKRCPQQDETCPQQLGWGMSTTGQGVLCVLCYCGLSVYRWRNSSTHSPGGGTQPITHYWTGGYILGFGKPTVQWQRKWREMMHVLFRWWTTLRVRSAFQTPQCLFLKSTSAKFQIHMGNQTKVNQHCCLCMEVRKLD